MLDKTFYLTYRTIIYDGENETMSQQATKTAQKAHDTAQKRQSWDNRQYLSALADLREISRE